MKSIKTFSGVLIFLLAAVGLFGRSMRNYVEYRLRGADSRAYCRTEVKLCSVAQVHNIVRGQVLGWSSVKKSIRRFHGDDFAVAQVKVVADIRGALSGTIDVYVYHDIKPDGSSLEGNFSGNPQGIFFLHTIDGNLTLAEEGYLRANSNGAFTRAEFQSVDVNELTSAISLAGSTPECSNKYYAMDP